MGAWMCSLRAKTTNRIAFGFQFLILSGCRTISETPRRWKSNWMRIQKIKENVTSGLELSRSRHMVIFTTWCRSCLSLLSSRSPLMTHRPVLMDGFKWNLEGDGGEKSTSSSNICEKTQPCSWFVQGQFVLTLLFECLSAVNVICRISASKFNIVSKLKSLLLCWVTRATSLGHWTRLGLTSVSREPFSRVVGINLA